MTPPTRLLPSLLLLLLLSPAGSPVSAADGDAEACRERMERLETRAAKLLEALRLHVREERAEAATAVRKELEETLDHAEDGILAPLRARRALLRDRAMEALRGGHAEAARSALAEEKELASLEGDFGERLELLRGLLRDLADPASRVRSTGWSREGLRYRWFGPRTVRRARGPCVSRALDWLRRHQEEEGSWDADGFEARCHEKCGGPGYALFDPGVSGLALLAFLGAGETDRAGSHRETVATGLRSLRSIQGEDGCFGPRTTNRFTYNHAIATLAMAEAYGLGGSPAHRAAAQRGLDFIEACRNPGAAWRYGVRPRDNDTSVTGWMIAALHAGKAARLRVAPEAFDGARAWVERVTTKEWGKAGYTAAGNGPARPMDIMDRFPPDRSEALTAGGIAIRVMCGEDPRASEVIGKGVELCLSVLPRWEDGGWIDMDFWYLGTMALRQVGGEPWRRWRSAVETALIPHQRLHGCARGSWDPVGVWGREGGRVYSTALGALALLEEQRHGRLFGED